MQQLADILENVQLLKTVGRLDLAINQVAFDSRKVGNNDLFVALRGTQVDGHQFLEAAISQGARVLVVETLPENLQEGITCLQVANTQEALGWIAANYYGHPSRQLKVVGITGTNGKTTTATLLYDLIVALGYKAGLLSTVEVRIAGKILPATHTTPDALAIQAHLAAMVEAGCDYAVMEASSHAIDQRRIAGLAFAGAIFTNLSHDHLDYHRTFKDYIFAKKRLFDDLPETAFALVNVDDKRGQVMVQNTRARILTYSLRKKATYKAKILENSLTGLHLELDDSDFYTRLVGAFNAYNLLAVYGAAVQLGLSKMEVLVQLSGLESAAGRFETIVNQERGIVGIVDYAHTPDAVEKVLQTIEGLRKGSGKIITVLGCGGDRDKSKRPLMAQTACAYSQQVILTSDNPRSEDPLAILADMEKGVPAYAKQHVLTIADRREAIRTALAIAQKNDIILVAGKGHEKYQEIQGIKHPFDDVEVLKQHL